jgi:hypothetical protein
MQRFLMATIATLTLFALGAPSLSAHDEFRIIGTLMRVQERQIEVKQKDSRTVSIAVNKETLVTRDKKKVEARELTKGQSVVVDALGDNLRDLTALEVRIVPEIKPAGGK